MRKISSRADHGPSVGQACADALAGGGRGGAADSTPVLSQAQHHSQRRARIFLAVSAALRAWLGVGIVLAMLLVVAAPTLAVTTDPASPIATDSLFDIHCTNEPSADVGQRLFRDGSGLLC